MFGFEVLEDGFLDGDLFYLGRVGIGVLDFYQSLIGVDVGDFDG